MYTIIHWQHSNIQLKYSNLHLQHSCQVFNKHSLHSNIHSKHSINQVKHSKQACKIYLQHLDMHFKKAVIRFLLYFGHSTFNSTFNSNIRLFNCTTQCEYSIQTFNSNIRLEILHSIGDSIQTFDYSIGTSNINIQSKHSIQTHSNIET